MTQQAPSTGRVVVVSEPVMHCSEPLSAAALMAFFAFALGWSWTFGLLGAALKAGSPVVAAALSMTIGFGPSLAAVAVIAHTSGRAGLRRWLARCLQWRMGWSGCSTAARAASFRCWYCTPL